jgi:hypothetical protein
MLILQRFIPDGIMKCTGDLEENGRGIHGTARKNPGDYRYGNIGAQKTPSCGKPVINVSFRILLKACPGNAVSHGNSMAECCASPMWSSHVSATPQRHWPDWRGAIEMKKKDAILST